MPLHKRVEKKTTHTISWRWAKAKNPFFKLFVTLLFKIVFVVLCLLLTLCVPVYLHWNATETSCEIFFYFSSVYLRWYCVRFFSPTFYRLFVAIYFAFRVKCVEKEKKWFYCITSWNLLILWFFFLQVEWNSKKICFILDSSFTLDFLEMVAMKTFDLCSFSGLKSFFFTADLL